MPRLRFARRLTAVAVRGLAATCLYLGVSAGANAHTLAAHASWSPATHIETWAFDDGCNGGAGAAPSLVRRWLTFADSHCGADAPKARRDCHSPRRNYCYVIQYLDTDWYYPANAPRLPRSASDSWFLHAPPPNSYDRIATSWFGSGLLLDQLSPPVQSFFSTYVRRHYNRDDGLDLDWQSSSLSQELYYATCSCGRTLEIRTNARLRAAHQAMSAVLRHRDGAAFLQVDNALPPNPWLPQGLDLLNASIGVDGLSVEGLPTDGGTLDPYYTTLLDQIAYVANRTSGFVVPMGRAPAGASYQLQSRRVQEATMLLGYSPGHLVDWADMEQGSSHLAVWPEEGIYPTDPLQSMRAPGGRGCLAGGGIVCSRGGHNDLRVANGVFRREFGACYLRGRLFGPCAAIINTRGFAETVRARWLRQTYRHEIVFAGGDVQSYGRVLLTGATFAAGSSQVPAHDAVFLAP